MDLLLNSPPTIYQMNNPCKLAIAAIPPDYADTQIKFDIYCKSGKSINVISLKPLSNYSFESVASMLGSINFFDSQVLLDKNLWSCTANGSSINSVSIIKFKDEIICHEI